MELKARLVTDPWPLCVDIAVEALVQVYKGMASYRPSSFRPCLPLRSSLPNFSLSRLNHALDIGPHTFVPRILRHLRCLRATGNTIGARRVLSARVISQKRHCLARRQDLHRHLECDRRPEIHHQLQRHDNPGPKPQDD